MSDEESYECYGEGDMENSSPVNNVITKFVHYNSYNKYFTILNYLLITQH